MFNGKRKAVTFSFDDGITQDRRLISILNKYSLRATFNLNSGRLGSAGSLIRNDITVSHVRPRLCEIADIYKGHEIAAHTLTHPNLTTLSDDEIVTQVENDRLALSEIAGYDVVGFAYPGGGIVFDDRVARIIKERTGIKYCRTSDATLGYLPQDNLYEFNPSLNCPMNFDALDRLCEKFLADDGVNDCLLYIWGHSYEFDFTDTWERFECFCRMISGRDDIFYGTNREVLL